MQNEFVTGNHLGVNMRIKCIYDFSLLLQTTKSAVCRKRVSRLDI